MHAKIRARCGQHSSLTPTDNYSMFPLPAPNLPKAEFVWPRAGLNFRSRFPPASAIDSALYLWPNDLQLPTLGGRPLTGPLPSASNIDSFLRS